MTPTPSTVIAGGGIGGLTAALTLQRCGIEATVLEKAPALKPLGVGINLLPHAVRELDTLGLGDALAAISVAPEAISYYTSDGTHLYREPRGIDGGHTHPQRSVHRGRLHALLVNAVTERLGQTAIRCGAGLTGFTQTRDGVVAHTATGDLRADVLVGADGINSVVRSHLHPGPDPLLWSGVRMYRGAARMAAFLDGQTMAIVHGPDGVVLVTYPIGDGLVNWVLQVDDHPAGPLPGYARWNRPADPDLVATHVAGWKLGWLDAASLPGLSEQVFEYPMVDRDSLPHWGSGAVTLLGDAAHPMYPVGANGASQAIVDARVLADELSRDPRQGLRRYEQRRRVATAEVIAANRRMHHAGTETTQDIARVTARYRADTERSHS
ncbi:2-polyprenyl-6-methoxyphenol hydroxylase-like FAD-dependent oxidoreductase [Mycolicibacterium iranicum]|uniref:2-polyprenyl-6-methoxyphenol hydroxylase-like FAD-dependent oxidoreductase n=1 Tax=Mycolicibacterium iranicum TaxID=912594 RepID=A0A839QH99_MYCIR|nr:FAD-dependent monooxygenase [Mycolicibacterium iranicum]MBB2993466.1 2-polyprenyl-6-methoxyphenol hydroxylase-like FAD-dependent oxidoreductase [Mycolicibacterium iranicum]